MNIAASITGNGIPAQFAETEKRKEQQAGLRSVPQDRAVARFKENLPGNKQADVAEAAIAHLEKIRSTFNKRLQFVINHESSDVTVNVIDSETDKVIKVLPPEELQRLSRKIEETIGFLFDEKV
jgi:flagellar protein FlaG